jgi:hypothetical protein
MLCLSGTHLLYRVQKPYDRLTFRALICACRSTTEPPTAGTTCVQHSCYGMEHHSVSSHPRYREDICISILRIRLCASSAVNRCRFDFMQPQLLMQQPLWYLPHIFPIPQSFLFLVSSVLPLRKRASNSTKGTQIGWRYSLVSQ